MKRLPFFLIILILWSCSDEESPSLTGHWVDVNNEQNSVTFNKDGTYQLDIQMVLPQPWGSGIGTNRTISGNYDLKKDKIQLKNSDLQFLDNDDIITGFPIASFYGYTINGYWQIEEPEPGTILPGTLKSENIWTIISLSKNKLVVELKDGTRITYKKA